MDIQGALALFDRIFEYLDLPLEITDKPDALALKPETTEGRLAFQHVTFHYRKHEEEALAIAANGQQNGSQRGGKKPDGPPGRVVEAKAAAPFDQEREPERATLEDVNFEVLPGQLAALVGPSGAGKTTITYLVPRLYDAERVAVQIDGHDVRDVTLASLGETIGVVTQETYLFHTSVRDNLLYGRPDATEEEMRPPRRPPPFTSASWNCQRAMIRWWANAAIS